jgi:hypothetical protein
MGSAAIGDVGSAGGDGRVGVVRDAEEMPGLLDAWSIRLPGAWRCVRMW